MTTENGQAITAAKCYHEAGYSILPIRPDGSKRPVGTWKEYTVERMAASDIDRIFGHGRGVGLILGEISGNAEALDLDRKDLFPLFVAEVGRVDPGLVERITLVDTPLGYHFIFRCETIAGSQKLAQEVAKNGEVKTLFETKGEKAYIVAVGSPASCHPTGRLYKHVGGPKVSCAPWISTQDRELLLSVARSFHAIPEVIRTPTNNETPNSAPGTTGPGLPETIPTDARIGTLTVGSDSEAPGTDFNKNASWSDVLCPHGWVDLGTNVKGITTWQRPGKDGPGGSATTGCISKDGNDLLCVFSTNAHPFEGATIHGSCTTYTKFAAYALLNHNGDYRAAAHALREKAYGGDKESATAQARGTCPEVTLFMPFPISVLPATIAEFVVTASGSIHCDPTYVALPLLCGLSGAVGATRRARITETWYEPCVQWGAVCGESGTQKTSGQGIALQPLEDRQAWQLEQMSELLEAYERDKLIFESDKKYWHSKGRTAGEPPPLAPPSPKVSRYVISDVTVEAVAARLHENPRGLLCSNDELGAWLGGMGRYTSGSRGEVGQWLSMHRAGRLLVDRKTGQLKTIHVRNAAISIIGGITPQPFKRAMTGDALDNGLAARFLVTMPPRRPKRYKKGGTDWLESLQLDRLYGGLLALDYRYEDDAPFPVELIFDTDAEELVEHFVNEHGDIQEGYEGHMASVYSKLEAAAIRFALLFRLVRWADGESPADTQGYISADDLASGITLARWFAHEWERVYASFWETSEDRDRRQLIEWIDLRGGEVTVRKVQQGHRRLETAGAAEAALNELAKADLGEWLTRETKSGRGPKVRVFRLSTPSTSTGLP